MKEYESVIKARKEKHVIRRSENNPFASSFGDEPIKCISRVTEKQQLIRNIMSNQCVLKSKKPDIPTFRPPNDGLSHASTIPSLFTYCNGVNAVTEIPYKKTPNSSVQRTSFLHRQMECHYHNCIWEFDNRISSTGRKIFGLFIACAITLCRARS